jgi:hypothetical protein
MMNANGFLSYIYIYILQSQYFTSNASAHIHRLHCFCWACDFLTQHIKFPHEKWPSKRSIAPICYWEMFENHMQKKCLFISFYTWSQLDTPSSSALCFGSLPRARIQQHSFRVDLSHHLTTDTTSMSDHTIRNICHVGHLQVKTATSTGPELS